MAKIFGYRELTDSDIALINEVKALGLKVQELITKVDQYPSTQKDTYGLLQAEAHLKTGFRWLTSAVARPEGF